LYLVEVANDATEHMRKDFGGAVFISFLLATWRAQFGSFGFFQFPIAAHASKNCGKKEQ
jgi:hypothetical protein